MIIYKRILAAVWVTLMSGFIAADLMTSLWFVLGSVGAWILAQFLRDVGWKRFILWGIATSIAVFVLICFLIFGVHYHIPSSVLEDYRAELSIFEPTTQKFKLIERFRVNGWESGLEHLDPNHQPRRPISRPKDIEFSLEEESIEARRVGLIVREIFWYPLEAKNGRIDLKLSGGFMLRGPLCGFACPPATVTIRDLPSGAFFGARYARNVEISEYLGKETVRFTVDNLEAGIRIAYLPGLLRFMKPVLAVFYKAGSIGGLLIVILTAVVGFLVFGVFKPLLEKHLQERVTGLRAKEQGGKNRSQSTCVDNTNAGRPSGPIEEIKQGDRSDEPPSA